jgi:hypothetical protein
LLSALFLSLLALFLQLLALFLALAAFLPLSQALALRLASIFHCRSPVFFFGRLGAQAARDRTHARAACAGEENV